MSNALTLATAALTAFGATALAVVNDGDPDPPNVGALEAPASVPTSRACGAASHPCTWAEVSESVSSSSHAFGRAAAFLIGNRGRSTDSVATLLAGLDGVAEVGHDSTTIRFRLDGGRPVWVLADAPGEGVTKGGGTAVGTAGSAEDAAPKRPVLGLAETAAPTQQANTKGLAVGREGQAKHALIAAPFEWEFKESVAGYIVNPLRRGKKQARGYSPAMGGTVVFLENPDTFMTYGNAGVQTSPDVGDTGAQGTVDLSAFEGWREKDFIYVTTHGRAVCEGTESAPGECWTTLSVGRFHDPQGDLLTRFGSDPGITVHYQSGDPVTTPACQMQPDAVLFLASLNLDCLTALQITQDARLGVTTEFFAARYGTGLPNSIVFLDACQSLLHGDIGRILVGNSSKTFVFGFNRSVNSTFSQPIAHKVLNFILDGTPTTEWRQRLTVEMGQGLVVLSGPAKSDGPGVASTVGGQAGASVAQVGGRVRGRDVIELHDPMMGEELDDGGALRLVGVPGDGRGDSVHIKALGVGLPDLDEASAMQILITLDSSQVLPDPLSFDSRPGVDTSAVQRTIALGFDASPGQVVDLVVRAETPNGEFTEWPYNDVRLESCGWWAQIVEPDGDVATVAGSTGRVTYVGPERWQIVLQRGRTSSDGPYESTASLRIGRSPMGNPRGLGVPFHMNLGYPGTRGGVTNETILRVQNGSAIGYEWVGEVHVDPAVNGGASGTFTATMVDSGHRQRSADLTNGDVRFPAFEYEISGAFSITDPRCVR